MMNITMVVITMMPSPITALAIDRVPRALRTISNTGAVNGKNINATTTGASGSDMTVLNMYSGANISKIGTDMNELASLAVGVAAPIATIMPLYIRIDTTNSATAMAIRTGSIVIIDRLMLGRSINLAAKPA